MSLTSAVNRSILRKEIHCSLREEEMRRMFWTLLWCLCASTFSMEASAFTTTSTPIGYRDMCAYRAYLCVSDKNTQEETPPYQLGAEGLNFLLEINRYWNEKITPRIDKAEYWSGSVTIGDCEEFAVAKRRTLIRNGFSPSQVLLLMVKEDPNSSMAHLVVLVRTDRGNFILDNLNQNVVTFEATRYIFVKRQREDNPFLWTTDSLR